MKHEQTEQRIMTVHMDTRDHAIFVFQWKHSRSNSRQQQTKSYDYDGLWRLMKLTLVDEGIIKQRPSSVTRSLNYIRVKYSVISLTDSRRSGHTDRQTDWLTDWLTICMDIYVVVCLSFIYSLQRFACAGGITVLVKISRDDIQSPSVKHNIHS